MSLHKKPIGFKPWMRRRWIALGLLVAVLPQWACSQQERSSMKVLPAPLSSEDAALKYRFRDVGGGELYVTGFAVVGPVALFEENGNNYHSIRTWFDKNGGGVRSSYGGGVLGDQLVIPKTLRMIRYEEDARIKGNATPFSAFEGAVVADVTVPVASRIPEDLLEDLRRDPKGGLRLKLRIHPDTLLVGWDIERRPGFDPKKRDQFGEAVYVAPVHSFAGGDFREAKIFNGQVVRKGWYIDPKTGQKIETDF
jgi:hypothetical protein